MQLFLLLINLLLVTNGEDEKCKGKHCPDIADDEPQPWSFSRDPERYFLRDIGVNNTVVVALTWKASKQVSEQINSRDYLIPYKIERAQSVGMHRGEWRMIKEQMHYLVDVVYAHSNCTIKVCAASKF